MPEAWKAKVRISFTRTFRVDPNKGIEKTLQEFTESWSQYLGVRCEDMKVDLIETREYPDDDIQF